MDFEDTPEEKLYRCDVRNWLAASQPTTEEKNLHWLDYAKLWQKRKFDAGWACISWPKKYGGRDATPIQQVIWNQEESRYELPHGWFSIGMGMAAPTLLEWADEKTKARYLPPLASGQEIWCQLFSEPAGGSDLAAIRTKATRDGNDWIVNGQKNLDIGRALF